MAVVTNGQSSARKALRSLPADVPARLAVIPECLAVVVGWSGRFSAATAPLVGRPPSRLRRSVSGPQPSGSLTALATTYAATAEGLSCLQPTEGPVTVPAKMKVREARLAARRPAAKLDKVSPAQKGVP